MPFQLLPILETMLQFYQQPKGFDRFQAYLQLLQGNTKGDLILPIGGFNPMGKEHVLEKLMELKALNIEEIIKETLAVINDKQSKTQPTFKVAFNLADDFKGAWTNRFTTDYDNKFKIGALIKRNFCTAIFWTSESFSAQIIKERTLEYCHRTIYWHSNPNPTTLQQHILQEAFIAKELHAETSVGIDFERLNTFYQNNKNSADHNLIFNFLYGDDAVLSLGNKPLGIKDPFVGFEFAKWLEKISKSIIT